MFSTNVNLTDFTGILYVDETIYKSLSNREKLATFFNKESGRLPYRNQSIVHGIVEGTISTGAFKKHYSLSKLYGLRPVNDIEVSYFVVFDCKLPRDHLKFQQYMKYFYLDEGKKLNAGDIKEVYFQRIETVAGRLQGLMSVEQEKLERMFVPVYSSAFDLVGTKTYKFTKHPFDCIIKTLFFSKQEMELYAPTQPQPETRNDHNDTNINPNFSGNTQQGKNKKCTIM